MLPTTSKTQATPRCVKELVEAGEGGQWNARSFDLFKAAINGVQAASTIRVHFAVRSANPPPLHVSFGF
jgi:hypothetical protein